MGSAHEEAAHGLLRHMATDPDWMPHLLDTQERLRRHEIPTSYSRIFGQVDGRASRWPLEQVACFLSLHGQLNVGRLARVDIDLGKKPSADADRAANAAVVNDLPHPFNGWLDAGQNSSPSGDGLIRWSEPITACCSTGLFDATGTDLVYEERKLRPTSGAGGIPLEIGSTKASVVAAHLAVSRAVARWPYDSRVLVILVDTEWYGRSTDSGQAA